MSRFRADRFVTLYLVRPLIPAGDETASVPVLMYHSISDRDEARLSPYYRTCTPPDTFREQMASLKQAGCQTLDLGELVRLLSNREPVPARSVVITFDDGFHDFYTAAFPVLDQHAFTATMFLPTEFIQRQRRSFNGIDCLTWGEVDELRRHRIRFGSHTVTHPRLYGLAWDGIRRELEHSRTELENHLGEPVKTFAYPYAYPCGDRVFAETFEQLLQETGYECNVTTQIGRVKAGDSAFRLRRLPVNSCDDRKLFSAKMAGAYDWLERPQSLVKSCKHRLGISRRS